MRRLAARALARDLAAFVVPDARLARATGLDPDAVGLDLAVTPRHAAVLLLVGEIPPGLAEAAAVVYAEMPRPRAILALGAASPGPLPAADVVAATDQASLGTAVARLRRLIAAGAWEPDAPVFAGAQPAADSTAGAAMDHAQMGHGAMGHGTMMHADVATAGGGHPAHHGAHDRRGTAASASGRHDHDGRRPSGPETVETGAEHDHHHSPPTSMHAGHAHDAPSTQHHATHHGHSDGAGDDHGGHAEPSHEAREHDSSHSAATDQTAKQQAAAVEAEIDHGAMDHAAMGHHDHASMDHGAMDHEGMDHGGHMMGGFMSMVAMTKDLPRSRDGLPMEWVAVPFGPLFPGLPGGLGLTLTLDGDGVAGATLTAGAVHRGLESTWPGPAADFPGRLARLDPLAPIAYRTLARQALETAAALPVNEVTARARTGAVERERATSHLGWLAELGRLLGDAWLAQRAAALQLSLVRAGAADLARLRPAMDEFARQVMDLPLLRRRLAGIGDLSGAAMDTLSGPAARARDRAIDARADDTTYRALGFAPRIERGGDALARLRVRLAEIGQSLDLVLKVGAATDSFEPSLFANASGEGTATVETPRGAATLHLVLEHGIVTAAHVDAPSPHLAALVPTLVEQAELADALVAVASLDLSPWEMAG